MAVKTVSTRKKPAARRSSTPARKPTATKRAAARSKKLTSRIARKAGTWAARAHARRKADRGARRDAAILRNTHAGCDKCDGTGRIIQRKKDGSYNGSKSCPAKPKKVKVSRTRVAIESRYGQDKRSGLHGWSCPCGRKSKPHCRTPQSAISELRQHEKKKHAGESVGGAWYLQIPATGTSTPTTKTAVLTAA